MNSNYYCPVCGFFSEEFPVFEEDGNYSRSFGEICPSCSFEYGVTDDNDGYTYQQWREKWIKEGMKWGSILNSKFPGIFKAPEGWNPIEQMKNIPPKWK